MAKCIRHGLFIMLSAFGFRKEEAKPDDGDLKIIEPIYKWNGQLSSRSKTEHLILHHAAANGSAEDIHRYHVVRDGQA